MKYRKKPVVIEAFRFTGEDSKFRSEWPLWLLKAEIKGEFYVNRSSGWHIKTLEGPLAVSINDWIIKGVKGELYPCKPDIFDMTYEPVPEPS